MDERRKNIKLFRSFRSGIIILIYYITQLIILHLSVEYLAYRSTEMMLRKKKNC